MLAQNVCVHKTDCLQWLQDCSTALESRASHVGFQRIYSQQPISFSFIAGDVCLLLI